MQFGSEFRLAIVAAAVEDGEGDAILDKSADDDVITALHISYAEHHIS